MDDTRALTESTFEIEHLEEGQMQETEMPPVPAEKRTARSRDSQVKSLRQMTVRDALHMLVKCFLVMGMVVGCVTLAFLFFWVGTLMRDTLISTPKNKHLTRNQMRTYFRTQCPGLGKDRPCNSECQVIWDFYAQIGSADLATCGTYARNNPDQRDNFEQCVKDLTADMTNPTFNVQKMLRSMDAVPDCSCGSSNTSFELIHLLTACPYSEQQYFPAIATGSNVDAVCMRPGASINPLIVPRPDPEQEEDEDLMCANCTAACRTNYQNFQCCDQTCTDVTSDSAHCGRCGLACAPDENCHHGQCYKVEWDTCNCGSYGERCGKRQMCKESQCLDPLTDSDAEFAFRFLSCGDSETNHRMDTVFSEEDAQHIAYTVNEVCVVGQPCHRAFTIISDWKSYNFLEPPKERLSKRTASHRDMSRVPPAAELQDTVAVRGAADDDFDASLMPDKAEYEEETENGWW